MEIVVTIPVRLRDFKKEDLIAAAERREKYTLVRDLQAKEFNRAIVSRLAKDRAIVSRLAKDRETVSRLAKPVALTTFGRSKLTILGRS